MPIFMICNESRQCGNECEGVLDSIIVFIGLPSRFLKNILGFLQFDKI